MNRRKFLKLSALTAGNLISFQFPGSLQAAGVSTLHVQKAFTDSSVKAMELEIKYITKIMAPPKSGKTMEFWVPLAPNDYEQEITRITVDSPAGFMINEEKVYGNKMVYTASSRLKAGDRISISYRLRRTTANTIVDKNEDFRKHLILSEREKWDKDIANFTESVVGATKDPLEIGRKIYYALISHLTYDKTIPGCGFGNSAWTFENKAGRCDDFHALFRTMMIYNKIPVRWEQGIPLPYPSALTASGKIEGDCTGAHCWVRFYTGNGRWVPVDVSEADKREDLRDYFFGTLSPNRFKVSTGRDLVLTPPQKGDPLNTFPFSYGESDGIPLIYGHNFKNEIFYELLHIEV